MQHRFFLNRGAKTVSVVAGLALLGAVAMFSGHDAGSPHSAVAAMMTPATSTETVTQQPAAGFPDVAKTVRPAVVNITPSKTLVRGRERHDPRNPFDSMEEFFGFPRRPYGPRPHGPQGPMDREPRGDQRPGVRARTRTFRLALATLDVQPHGAAPEASNGPIRTRRARLDVLMTQRIGLG